MNQLEENKTTLKQFLKDNYQLLTVMGVFGALFTLFSREIYDEIHRFGRYLIIVTFFIFIVTSVEILNAFWQLKNQVTKSLILFKVLFIYFIFFVGLFAFYHFIYFKERGKEVLLLVILVTLGTPSFPIIDKKANSNKLRIFLYAISLIIIVILGFFLQKLMKIHL